MFKAQNSKSKVYGKFKVMGGSASPEDIAQDEILFQIWLSQNVGLHQYFAVCGCGNHLKWAYNKTPYASQAQAQDAAAAAASVFNTWLTENIGVDEYIEEEGEFYGTWAYGSTTYPSESAARTAASNAAFQVWLTNNVNIHQYTVAGPNYGKWGFYNVAYNTQAEAQAAEADSYNVYQSWLTNNHGINQYFGTGGHNGQWALDNTEYPSEASAVAADAVNGDTLYFTWKTTNVGVKRYNRGGSRYGQWLYGSTEYPSQEAAEAAQADAEEADYQAWLTTTTDIDEVQYTGSGPHNGQWVFFKAPYASRASAVTAKRARHNALFQIWIADNLDINQYFGLGECNGLYYLGNSTTSYSTFAAAQSAKLATNGITFTSWLSSNIGVNQYSGLDTSNIGKWAYNSTNYSSNSALPFLAAITDWLSNNNIGIVHYLGENHGAIIYYTDMYYNKWYINGVGPFNSEEEATNADGFTLWLKQNVGVNAYYDEITSNYRYAFNDVEYGTEQQVYYAQFLSNNTGVHILINLDGSNSFVIKNETTYIGPEQSTWAFNQTGNLTLQQALEMELQAYEPLYTEFLSTNIGVNTIGRSGIIYTYLSDTYSDVDVAYSENGTMLFYPKDNVTYNNDDNFIQNRWAFNQTGNLTFPQAFELLQQYNIQNP